MNTRYKITRLDEQQNPLLTLEECQHYFAQCDDFEYHDAFGSSKDGVHMKIKGHFFMWKVDQVMIPFRFFDGELYVAVSHPVILEKTKEIARNLQALYVEG